MRMKDVSALWEKAGHPPLSLSFAASSTLARQIEQGAPANVFASADEKWMDYLAGKNLIATDTRKDLLGNDLVLVVPANKPQHVTIGPGFDLAKLLGPNGRLAVGDPAHVPAGIYAEQALQEARAVGQRLGASGAHRRRARRSAAGGARRGAGRHRLRHRRRRLEGRDGGGHVPREQPRSGVLSVRRGEGRRHAGGPRAADLPGGSAGPRGVRRSAASRSNSLNLSAEEWTAVRLTLAVAARAVGFGLPLAVLMAWLLARYRFPGRALLNALVHLPLVLPPVVTGWLLLIVFGIRGPVGALLYDWFGVRLVFTTAGAALACAVMTFPVMVRAIRLSLEAADPGLEQAARTLGAGRFDRLLNVTLPLASPGILVGGIVAYATCLGEFGAVITFAANIPGQTQTLPLAIYAALQVPGGEAKAAELSLVSLTLALVGLLLSEWVGQTVERGAGPVSLLRPAAPPVSDGADGHSSSTVAVARHHGAVRPVGFRQVHRHHRRRRPAAPGRMPHRGRRQGAGRHRRRASGCRRNGAAWAWCSRTPSCSRTCRC